MEKGIPRGKRFGAWLFLGALAFFLVWPAFSPELGSGGTLSQPAHQHDHILCPGVGYGSGQQGYGG